jgi:predicted RNase H-like HicB family nuclease
MDSITYKVSVLVTETDDLRGEWVAHCLDLDLISQGSSLDDALEAIRKAVETALQDDLACGREPADRPRAPDRYWEVFGETVERGQPMEQVIDRSEIHTLVAQMRFEAQPPSTDGVRRVVSDAPPTWQFAALERVSCLDD